jgi:hypothetical protein
MADKMSDADWNSAIFDLMGKVLAGMSDEDRVETWRNLMDDYCEDCGRKLGQYQSCHCRNDE